MALHFIEQTVLDAKIARSSLRVDGTGWREWGPTEPGMHILDDEGDIVMGPITPEDVVEMRYLLEMWDRFMTANYKPEDISWWARTRTAATYIPKAIRS